MNKRKGKEKIRKQNKIDRLLEIPKELSSNEPKITIISLEKMIIENYSGILEYQDFFIRLKTCLGLININGYNLKLENMTTDDLIIEGKIESIDFERTMEE